MPAAFAPTPVKPFSPQAPPATVRPENKGDTTVEIIYFTLVAIGLYAFTAWVLDRVERARGRRFKNRNIIFFVIILVLALLSFELMGRLGPMSN